MTAEGGSRLPGRARAVVIGGGIAGCSVLHHLVRLGWSDTVLLEKGQLTSGSTWHAAGLCTQLHPSRILTKLLLRSMDLYRALDRRAPGGLGLHLPGSVRLACSDERLDEFRARADAARVAGLDLRVIGPGEVADLFPLADLGDVLGAAFLPSDGHVDPSSITVAMADRARERGASILTRTAVRSLERIGEEWRVGTDRGSIDCEIVVNAAGMWAPQVAALAGVRLPIVPLQHQYVVTDTVDELVDAHRELPVLRDPDGSFYVRQEGDALLVGPFEPAPLTWALDGVPMDFEGKLLPGSLDQIESVLVRAADRVPVLGRVGLKTILNGPDGYTPDGRCLMGEVPGRTNLFVLAGFSIFGIVFGGGAGEYLAEWITEGQPSDSMWELDVRRFGPYADTTAYVAARAREVYEREYSIHYPEDEWPAGRPAIADPLYPRLRERGAVFGERSGWECPLWFAPDGVAPRDRPSFRIPNWHEHVGEECRAVRRAVGILDQTSFAKFEVAGPGAEELLDRLCANRLPAELGRIVLTQMLTPCGGIECDLTVTRLTEDCFYVVSAAATETHDLAWIKRHMARERSVQVQNVTARFGVLTIAGPRSRDLLARLTEADISGKALPFFGMRELELAGVPARTLRLSYVGELGYELHHPIELSLPLYEALLRAGENLGLVDFGYRALESMRLEKGYRLWGADIDADHTPLEAGLERFVAFEKGEFIGRDALLREGERGYRQMLACLALDGDGLHPHGGEPILFGDEVVGFVSAGGYGHCVGRAIALAYLPRELVEAHVPVEVVVLGERMAGEIVSEPLYDPDGDRPLERPRRHRRPGAEPTLGFQG
ncbi:MAG: FAD-dependent oxidoreductase [Actinomycetota bacterium]|nr:FAD-dependent oxidoreductase [Actinomycetota bacterium]